MQIASVLNSYFITANSSTTASQTPGAPPQQQPANQLVPYNQNRPICDYCQRQGHSRNTCNKLRYQQQPQQGQYHSASNQQYQQQYQGPQNNRLNNNGVSVVTQSRFVGKENASPRINGKCFINSVPVLFQLDTGLDRTVINEETARRLSVPITRPSRVYS